MSIVVILGIAWSAFLIRTVGKWLSGRSANSLDEFGRTLSRLGNPRRPVPFLYSGSPIPERGRPRSTVIAATRARRACKRRRDVFLALCALATGSLVLGLLPGLGALLTFHIVVDVMLGLYTAALLRRKVAPASLAIRQGAPATRFADGLERRYDLGTGYALASGE